MEIDDRQRADCAGNRCSNDKELKPSLPDSITIDILVGVSHQHHVSLKRVCKYWKDIINGLVFSGLSSFQVDKKAVRRDFTAQKEICQSYMMKTPCLSKSFVRSKRNYTYRR